MDESEKTPRNQLHTDVSLNAIELHAKRSHNLNDPFVDVELKVNNPIGRIWEAIKKIWKSQKTVVSLKFTIPLLVLPIVIFVGYRLWLGRGVNTPMAKVGVIHEVSLNGKQEYALILPTSDVYMLQFPSNLESFPSPDKPVIVFGVYNHIVNVLNVENVAYYNPSDARAYSTTPSNGKVSGTSLITIITTGIWTPISNFLKLFQ
jgi:hypothetical protein